MIVGVIVILLVGFLAIRYLSRTKTESTLPPIETEITGNPLPTTYSVSNGDTLWSISEKYYGTGYNWVDIKDANNLKNADEINEGQELTIPDVTPRVLEAKATSEITRTKESVTLSGTPTPEVTQQTADDSNQSTPSTYTVQKGDSLWKIAQANLGDGNKWTEIAKNNELKNPSVIRTGQELKLSEITTGQITPEAASTSASSYTVIKGDSLWSIAQGTYGDSNQWIKIAKANNLKHPSLIHPGNTLIIPE